MTMAQWQSKEHRAWSAEHARLLIKLGTNEFSQEDANQLRDLRTILADIEDRRIASLHLDPPDHPSPGDLKVFYADARLAAHWRQFDGPDPARLAGIGHTETAALRTDPSRAKTWHEPRDLPTHSDPISLAIDQRRHRSMEIAKV